MPQQVEELLTMLRSQILDISGQGEVSRGNLPPSARSGVQVAYMQEEDETRLAPTAENIEIALARSGSLSLERVDQFYHTDRIVRLYRSDGTFDVLRFKSSDLKGNTDVIVQAGSALPQYKAARQQFVLELAQLGIERNPKRIRDMLELGQGEPDDDDKAAAQATRENNAMIQGILTGSAPRFYGLEDPNNLNGDSAASSAPPEIGMGDELSPETQTRTNLTTGVGNTLATFPVAGGGGGGNGEAPVGDTAAAPDFESQATGASAPSQMSKTGPVAIPVKNWHNHQIHLERHYAFMMDEYFESLAERHPEVVRLFDEHTAMHEKVLADQRAQQLQQLQAARGAPGPQGDSAVSPSPQGQPDVLTGPDLKAGATA